MRCASPRRPFATCCSPTGRTRSATWREVGGEPVGFAFWFYNVSTFEGRRGLYLEDLYVRPQARGLGAGKALLAHLARRCLDEGLARMEWSVLDWNAPAIAFYDGLGASAKTQWITRQLKGEALQALAGA